MDIDEGHGKVLTHAQAAKSNAVCMAAVTNIVKDYSDGGIDTVTSLGRNPNSDNARRKLDGRAEAKIIAIACGPVPEGRSRWTLRLLEEKARIALDVPVGKDAIQKALKRTNFGLTKTTIGVSLPKETLNL
jgi:transposase